MGQTTNKTKLLLDLSRRSQGGASLGKRSALEATTAILNAARQFYLDFSDKLMERIKVVFKKTGEVREAVISADALLTWAEFQTVETREHPHPLPEWNFSKAFPDFPTRYRRSVLKVQDSLSIGTVFSGRLYGSRAKKVRSWVSKALKDCLKAEAADGANRQNNQTPA
jgi:hypothetical protein